MLYNDQTIFNHGIDDGLYGYSYINPNWDQENLKDYQSGYTIGKIQLLIKNNEFQNCTYELLPYCYLIHIWQKNHYKALNLQVENKKELEEFKKLTGINSIKRQH